MSTASPPTRTVRLLLAGYLAAVVLNIHHVAPWCMPLALGASIWRVRSSQTKSGKSRRLLRYALVSLLTLAVLIGFRTLNGLQAGASLLVAMAALKLTETAARRDWLIVVGASLFLLLAACLDAQMLWRLPLYAAELCLLCMGMYALGAGTHVPELPMLLRRSAKSIGMALPFAALLFLFVPRLAGSLWTLPQEHQATTGLSDEMSPGNISELTQSAEQVARVRFEGTPPPVEQRYWRGFVLHSFDGDTWRRGRNLYHHAAPLAVMGAPDRYEVTMEATRLRVLLALELPQHAPESLDSVRLTDDYQLWSSEPITRAMTYRVESFPEHRSVEPLSTGERDQDLHSYPKTRNLRSLELARSLREQSGSDAAFVNRVLDYFRTGGFRYTLDPELLNKDSVDDLLFNTHEGFCGHFASAFVLLMRAGGVPARVVTGYLGGSWNRYGGYLLVRQSDAHAWAEIWLDDRGWVRVDPTAVVAPGRLTHSLVELRPATTMRRMFSVPWLVNTVQAWQAMNAWWQDKFIGYNLDKQRSLMEGFGFKDQYLRALTLLLAVGGSIWLAVLAWSLRPRSARASSDLLARSWRMFERKLSRAAAPRAQHEGPLAYADRVGRSRPDIADTVTALARQYAQLRYGPCATAADMEQFRRAVRRLPPIAPRIGRQVMVPAPGSRS
jgi:transglutaminase-like putative cysteine protease